jgi:hypothetical protein
MSTNLGKFQSASFRMAASSVKRGTIEFSMETTTGTISLVLSLGDGDTYPSITVNDEGKRVLEISDRYWSDSYMADDKLVDEKDFPRLVNECFEKYIEYSVSEWAVKPIEGTKYPNCLQFDLTKETDSGLITRSFSIVPSFSPCTFCQADMQLNVVYKIGDTTINELLTAYEDDSGAVHMGVKEIVEKVKKVKAPRIVDVGDGWFEVVKRTK